VREAPPVPRTEPNTARNHRSKDRGDKAEAPIPASPQNITDSALQFEIPTAPSAGEGKWEYFQSQRSHGVSSHSHFDTFSLYLDCGVHTAIGRDILLIQRLRALPGTVLPLPGQFDLTLTEWETGYLIISFLSCTLPLSVSSLGLIIWHIIIFNNPKVRIRFFILYPLCRKYLHNS
jgi:hypothetical protein